MNLPLPVPVVARRGLALWPRRVGLTWAFWVMAAALAVAADAPKDTVGKPDKDSPPVTLDEGAADFSNWAGLTLGGSIVHGNQAAFQQRLGRPAGSFFGGVEDLRLEHAFTNKWTLKLDGRGLFDYHDYEVKLDLTREDRGYFRAGYREFRTFYNGSGGYLPGAGSWQPLADSELFLDQGHAWVEGGLTLKGWPTLRVKYSHAFRDGRKDSTIWGQVNTPFGARGLGASFYEFNDKRDTIEGEITHTIGKTGLGLKLVNEWGSRNHSLNAQQFRGTPQSFVTQREGTDSGLFNVHGWSSTWFNKKTALSTGYGYTRLDTDLTGSRVYGDQFDPVYDPALLRGPGYINLSGGSRLNQHVANLSFMSWPWSHFAMVPAVRIEYQDVEGVSLYKPYNPGVTAGINLGGVIIPDPTATGYVSTDNARRQTTIGPRLELRYLGVTNWVFYTLGEWEAADGDMQERSRSLDLNVLSQPTDAAVQRTTDYQRFQQKYSLGAHWYPSRKLSLGVQYYYKTVDNAYDHRFDSTANTLASFNRYPAYLRENDFATHDANLRITWRPLPSLTSVTRYDYQYSTVDTRADGLAALGTARQRTHIISQSLTWSPLDRLYLQGSINYVLDETTTPVSDSPLTSSLVQKSRNDYWFATLGAGYAVGRRTDLLADYSYYRSDNWDPGNAQVSLPYGASVREHTFTAGLVHRFSQRLRGTLRYTFFQSDDDTSGGHNDFTAHVLSAGLQYRF